MSDRKRIADALEHLAYPAITHKDCAICAAKKKPLPDKKMPHVVHTNRTLKAREEAERARRMWMGDPIDETPESFRYQERE